MTPIAAVAVFALAAPSPGPVEPAFQSISSYYETSLRDVSFTNRVSNMNQAELRKINEDFAQSYRFKSMDVKIKAPFKVFMESKVDGDMSVVYIMNGADRKIRIPRAGISEKKNLAGAPGKRTTAFEFGLLPDWLFKGGYLNAKFVRTDRRTGFPVFDLYFDSKTGDESRFRVWIDPAKKIITRKEWYSQFDPKPLKATFEFTDPVKVNGVWVPTKSNVYNANRKLGGVYTFSNIKVNVGLSDSLFNVN